MAGDGRRARLPLTPMGDVLEEIAAGLHFTPAEREIMMAAYAAQLARHQAPPEERVRQGSTIAWAHDGSEVRGHDSPGYACPHCRDARFLRRDVPVGHPDFGRAIPCRCQREDPVMRQAAYERRVLRSGLPAGLRSRTLDTFHPGTGTQEAYQAALAFVASLRQREAQWVVFYGGTGRGKTHLLAGITQAALMTQDVAYETAPDFLAACQASVEVNGALTPFAHDPGLTAAVVASPVLVLDEIGSQTAGVWGREKLERILDQRWQGRLPTAVAVTVTPQEISAWSPRIASRLSDRSLVRSVVLAGGDYRQRLSREEAP